MNHTILSIIITNWNTADITLDCLRSIYQDKGLREIPFEIILIDNASTDHSQNAFKAYKKKNKLSNLNIIINDTNVGFGKANNQGLKIANGNYLLFLNSDTIILHGAISQSLNWLCSHPEASGCTGQLLNNDKSIQITGGTFPNIWNMFTWLTHLDDLPFINFLIPPYHPHSPDFYTKDKYYLSDHPQDWLTGAFLMFRKELVAKVGGFSPKFFMYGEEMELCYRIHLAYPKLKLWYLIGPQIIHLGGASATNQQEVYDREYLGVSTFFKIHRPLWQQQYLGILIKINQQLQLFLSLLK